MPEKNIDPGGPTSESISLILGCCNLALVIGSIATSYYSPLKALSAALSALLFIAVLVCSFIGLMIGFVFFSTTQKADKRKETIGIVLNLAALIILIFSFYSFVKGQPNKSLNRTLPRQSLRF